MTEKAEQSMCELAGYHLRATDQFRRMYANPHTPLTHKQRYLQRAEQHDEWYRAIISIVPKARFITVDGHGKI